MRNTEDEIRSIELALGRFRKEFEHQGSATPLRQRNGTEDQYGQAYQQLVKLGARSQLRLRYRGR